jgi:hypothetical protein
MPRVEQRALSCIEYNACERTAQPILQGLDRPGYGACKNAASVCRAFKSSCRQEVLSFEHHRGLAAVDADEARELLECARRRLQIRIFRCKNSSMRLLRSRCPIVARPAQD